MNEAKVAAIFWVGMVLGGAGVYWATAKPTKNKYERILETEIQSVKDHYRVVRKQSEYETPQDLLAERKQQEEDSNKYETKIAAYTIEQDRQIDAVSESKVEERSIFDYAQAGKTQGETVKEPIRIVTYEEFDGENEDYTKTTLTYYKADDTVADEEDDIIQDVGATIGGYALSAFGDDPANPDTVYIRNDRLRADYELLLEERSYREVVVGE